MPDRQLYLVAWDVTDDRRRQLLREHAVLFAAGGQYSAYECWMAAGERNPVCSHLSALLDEDSDCLLVLRLDPRWPVICLGAAVPPARDDVMLVS